MSRSVGGSRYRPGGSGFYSELNERAWDIISKTRAQFSDFAIREMQTTLCKKSLEIFNAVPRALQDQFVCGSLKMADLSHWVATDNMQKRMLSMEEKLNAGEAKDIAWKSDYGWQE